MLPLARYRFHFTASTPVHFPEWAGSTLRGGFGHALRRLACMTRQKDCTGCPLLHTCPYPAIFAPPPAAHSLQQLTQPPAPYVIEPAGWGRQQFAPGQPWHLDMVLMGRALRELPLISLAWQRAAQQGLGQGEGKSELAGIDYLPPGTAPECILTAPGQAIQAHNIQPPAEDTSARSVITLEFNTPLRLQDNGRAVPPEKLDAERLLMNLVRRLSLLAEFHGNGTPAWDFKALKQSAARVNSEKQLKWQDWTRRSSRQQQTMQLGGAVGSWTLYDVPLEFPPLLKLGEWVHLGKETVFGLGRYHLAPDSSVHNPEHLENPSKAIETKEENTTPRIQTSPDF